ncbi:hypothetical protein AB835_06675 [Candidatus Endobugula sertula]|uniref:Pentapeptide repeat-containing protein n=1 Tax=Candidatus Endobugula sertula TaxID=62101 RepID=A0A1D2QQH4_9GAMM|nr:hypothetical protein AB835_06675 [Candidatus Endobugula sertula]
MRERYDLIIFLKMLEYIDNNFFDKKCSDKFFGNIRYISCQFNQCDFQSAIFKSCKFIDCEFVNCNLSFIDLDYSCFSNTIFNRCKIQGVDWTRAEWGNTVIRLPLAFIGCLLNHSTFFGLDLRNTDYSQSVLRNVDFREAVLNGSNFYNTDLEESLFHGTEIEKCNFKNAKNYVINIMANRVKNSTFSLPEAMILLYHMDIIIE